MKTSSRPSAEKVGDDSYWSLAIASGVQRCGVASASARPVAANSVAAITAFMLPPWACGPSPQGGASAFGAAGRHSCRRHRFDLQQPGLVVDAGDDDRQRRRARAEHLVAHL